MTNAPINEKALKTAIASIAKRTTKLKTGIQTAAMNCMRHSHFLAGGGLDIFTSLWQAVGTSGNREQLARWVARYFPVRKSLAKDGKTVIFKLNAALIMKARQENVDPDTLWQWEAADETPWFDTETDGEEKSKAYDLDTMIKSLENMVKVINKRETDGDITDERVTKFGRNMLLDLQSRIGELKKTSVNPDHLKMVI